MPTRDLKTTAPEPPITRAPPPTLLDLPDALFPIDLEHDPGARAPVPVHAPQRWLHFADALATATAATTDAAVRSAMSGEAGRIFVQQLGRVDLGERLFAEASPAVRRAATLVAYLVSEEHLALRRVLGYHDEHELDHAHIEEVAT